MTRLWTGSDLLRWAGRFLLVWVGLLLLVYGALVGWFLPRCAMSAGSGPLGWGFFVLASLFFYYWPVSLTGVAITAAIASASIGSATPRRLLWGRYLLLALSLLLLGALASWLSGGLGHCPLPEW
jgi:hypothetical protein